MNDRPDRTAPLVELAATVDRDLDEAAEGTARFLLTALRAVVLLIVGLAVVGTWVVAYAVLFTTLGIETYSFEELSLGLASTVAAALSTWVLVRAVDRHLPRWLRDPEGTRRITRQAGPGEALLGGPSPSADPGATLAELDARRARRALCPGSGSGRGGSAGGADVVEERQ